MTTMNTSAPELRDSDLDVSEISSVTGSENSLPKRGRDAMGKNALKVPIQEKNNFIMATIHLPLPVDVKGRTPSEKCPEPSSQMLPEPSGAANQL